MYFFFRNPNEPVTDTRGYAREWFPTYNIDTQQYLDIGLFNATVHERFHPRRMELWNNLIPKLKIMLANSQKNEQQHPVVPILIG